MSNSYLACIDCPRRAWDGERMGRSNSAGVHGCSWIGCLEKNHDQTEKEHFSKESIQKLDKNCHCVENGLSPMWKKVQIVNAVVLMGWARQGQGGSSLT